MESLLDEVETFLQRCEVDEGTANLLCLGLTNGPPAAGLQVGPSSSAEKVQLDGLDGLARPFLEWKYHDEVPLFYLLLLVFSGGRWDRSGQDYFCSACGCNLVCASVHQVDLRPPNGCMITYPAVNTINTMIITS